VLISYYQWVPLILLFQAMLAFVPCLVWRFVNKRSGVNMAAIMDAARHSSQAHYLEIREKVRLAIELSQFGPAVPILCTVCERTP